MPAVPERMPAPALCVSARVLERTMAESFSEADWGLLLGRLKQGRCTPFLGAGACAGVLPLGSEVAQEWADQYGYPLPDRTDLVRVRQYLAVKFDPTFPKERLLERFAAVGPPDFRAADEPHAALAD